MTTHYSSLVEAGNGGGFVFAGITLFLMESEGEGGGESVVAKRVLRGGGGEGGKSNSFIFN